MASWDGDFGPNRKGGILPKVETTPGRKIEVIVRGEAGSGKTLFMNLLEEMLTLYFKGGNSPGRSYTEDDAHGPSARSKLTPEQVTILQNLLIEVRAEMAQKPAPAGSAGAPGYHITDIPRGTYGEFSKIEEEFLEAKDANAQNARVMTLVELSDMMGAIKGYLDKRHPGTTLADLIKMSEVTDRAFINGHRKPRA